MDARPWLEQTRRELARTHLPPLYRERFMSELSDHFTDFLEDPMSTDAKDLRSIARHLGAPGELAHAAAHQYRKGRFCGRHPILSFVVLPILSLPILWFASIASLILVTRLLGFEGGRAASGRMAEWLSSSMPLITHALVLVPVVGAAAFFCWLAARSAVGWKWTLAACTLVAVLGGLAVANMVLPGADHRGSLSFGFGLSQQPSLAQIVQFALPMAIGGWAVWRQLSERRQHVLS